MNYFLHKKSNKSRINGIFILLIIFQILIIIFYILFKLWLGINDTETYNIIIDNKLPRIEIEGYKNIDDKGKSTANLKYYEDTLLFEEVVDISIQGGTSVVYPKKNYNIDIINDSSSNIQFSDWYKMERYCLKANYVDFSMARNTVASKVWSDIVDSRDNINPYLKEIINYGAVDGYPVALYLNGKYKGIYNINTSKDHLFNNMEEGNYQAVLFGDDLESITAQFKETSETSPPNGGWQLVYNSEDNTQWITDSFNQLIEFNLNSNGEAFKQGINEYLDVEAAIDYLIYYQFLSLVDNQYKNLIWVTYDGTQWIPSAYDLDKSFGLDLNGVGFFSTYVLLPYYDSREQAFYANSRNILWSKLLNTHRDEIAERYFELRDGALSINNITNSFKKFSSQIPQELFVTERSLYPAIPSMNISDLNTIVNHLTERAKVMDRFYTLYANDTDFSSDDSKAHTKYTVTIECPLREDDLTYKLNYNQAFNIDKILESPLPEYEFDKLLYKDSNKEFVSGTNVTQNIDLQIVWKVKEVKTITSKEPVETKASLSISPKVKLEEFTKKIKFFIKETKSESFFVLIFIILFVALIFVYICRVREEKQK